MAELEADDYELVDAAFASAGSRGWVRANCPLCALRTGKTDTRQSMGLNCATGGFICHKCGATGILFSRAPDLGEMQEELEPAAVEPAKPVQPCTGYVALGSWPGSESIQLEFARGYLRGRGVSEQAVEEAEVGAVCTGWLRSRVVVPHLGLDGKWVGWIARDVTGQAEMKYRYASGMNRDLLWNQRALLEQTMRPLMLVEGVFDALPYWPDVCAFLGKPTSSHFSTLSLHRGRPVIVCLDGDSWEEGWSLAGKLIHGGSPAGFVKLPAGEDPGSVDPGSLLKIVSESAGRFAKL